MVKGGTNFRSGKRFKKRKCPRSSFTSSNIIESSEVESFTINEDHEEDGEISGPSTAVNGNIPSGHLEKKKKCRSFDVNRRSFYAMRRIGNGHVGLKRFLMLMNHPPPMHEKNYRNIGYTFYDGVKEVAESVMKEACDQVRSLSTGYNAEDNVIMDTGVTLDGTWQKRGFTSYNGAVMAISIHTGKILDLEAVSVLSILCKYRGVQER